MIKLVDLIKEIEEGIEDVEFVSPEETDVGYLQDLQRIERETAIHVSRWKHLSVLAIKSGKCVGALYDGTTISNNKNIYGFDIVVDKQERRQGIGAKLIDIGISTYEDLPSSEEYMLVLDVVNAHLVRHLAGRGLKIIASARGHIIMSF